MYLQIVDDDNMRLYDMIRAVGGDLVARKVDCCMCHLQLVGFVYGLQEIRILNWDN